MAQGYLLQADHDAPIQQAQAKRSSVSSVLGASRLRVAARMVRHDGDGGPFAPNTWTTTKSGNLTGAQWRHLDQPDDADDRWRQPGTFSGSAGLIGLSRQKRRSTWRETILVV
jgi:hypothetical protein